MADDILGHEHLDHGKHLHKGPNAHHHGHHGHGAHGHKKHQSDNHIGVLHLRKSPVHDGSHAGHDTSAASAQASGQGTIVSAGHKISLPSQWKLWLSVGLGALILLAILAFSVPALVVVVVLLFMNTMLELHKLFTGNLPIDIEILYGGVAFVAADYGVAWAFIIVILGPSIAALARSHYCEEELIKTAALLVTAIAALTLGSQPASLFFAVLFGIVAQYTALSALGLQPAFNNVLARLTATGVNAYVLLLLLPSVLRG